MTDDVPGYDAIVLAGGRGRRSGADDKLTIDLHGRSVLDRTLDAVADADRVVAVGPQRPTERAVAWACEQPPGGGPVAAISAGLGALGGNDEVVVLAGDMPFAGRAVQRLLTAFRNARGESDGVLLVDAAGYDQCLLGVYDVTALRRAVAGLTSEGASMRSLIEPLRLLRLPAAGEESFDCDTPDDLERARSLLAGRG